MLLVDAANVIGSRPTGWWRDRPKAARDFVADLRSATASERIDGPVVVVLEGQAKRGEPEGEAGGVTVVHAPGEGDDTLVELMAGDHGESVVLVTADRALAERARRAGAEVVGPSWLLERMSVP